MANAHALTSGLDEVVCDLDGGDLRQVTDQLGYDGGAFFSHDGTQLVFRATHFVEPGPDGNLVGHVVRGAIWLQFKAAVAAKSNDTLRIYASQRNAGGHSMFRKGSSL